MFPDLCSIGPLTIHTYGVSVALGFVSAFMLTMRLARSYSMNYGQVMDMGFLAVVWGIIGSRMLFVLINFSYYRAHPLETFWLWDGGFVFSGGILAVVPALLLYSRRSGISFGRIGDLWAPGVALGQAIGSVGCFMAGCCFGKPLEGFWGVVFTHPRSLAPLNVSLHPTQLYAAFIGFLIAGILYVLYKRKKFEGQVFLWFLILHSTGRLYLERFRADFEGVVPGADMSATQLIALVLLIGSVISLFFISSRKKSSNPPSLS